MMNSQKDLQFVRQEMLDGKVTIQLPACLVDVEEQEMKENYKLPQFPEVFKADSKRRLLFLQYKNNSEITVKDERLIEESVLVQRHVLKRMTPGFIEIDSKVKEVNGHLIGSIAYGSTTLSEELYNLFFMFYANGDVISCLFSCLYKDKDTWGEIFNSCLESIQISE